jgi:hypothetical protein
LCRCVGSRNPADAITFPSMTNSARSYSNLLLHAALL